MTGEAAAENGFAAVNGFPPHADHEKDHHVIAAAPHRGAALVVTASLEAFPAAALSPHGIHAVHPDAFLLDQLDLDPTRVLRVLADQRADHTRPELWIDGLYRTVAVTVPGVEATRTA